MKIIEAKKHDRSLSIGGSEVAAVLGVNPWTSPLDIWRRKTSGWTPQVTPAMEWGTRLEDTVAKAWAEKSGRTIWRCTKVFGHDTYPITASPDRLVVPPGKGRAITRGRLAPGSELLEVKTSRSSNGWGDEGTDIIPLHYQAQVQTYLGITGLDWCAVAVLIGGSDFRSYTIHRNDSIVDSLFKNLAEWWERHVVAKVPPPPRSAEEVESLFPQSVIRAVVAPSDIESYIKQLVEVKAGIVNAEEQYERLKVQVCDAMKDADTLTTPDGAVLCTWRTAKPTRILDRAKLQEKLGDLAAYEREGRVSRRFLLKEEEA